MVLAVVSLKYFRQVTSRKVALLVTNNLCAKTDYLIKQRVSANFCNSLWLLDIDSYSSLVVLKIQYDLVSSCIQYHVYAIEP